MSKNYLTKVNIIDKPLYLCVLLSIAQFICVTDYLKVLNKHAP